MSGIRKAARGCHGWIATLALLLLALGCTKQADDELTPLKFATYVPAARGGAGIGPGFTGTVVNLNGCLAVQGLDPRDQPVLPIFPVWTQVAGELEVGQQITVAESRILGGVTQEHSEEMAQELLRRGGRVPRECQALELPFQFVQETDPAWRGFWLYLASLGLLHFID